ncbi:hypothetical protein [Sandaracinus amylolyticus]|uniref:Putative lipoprotein n=1 Tax=Sandaracinus amylolyticus TaxID=927083 RepID=A0A0F6YM57_9BACT|nr:hypothetical protein [Sandaracinus amylolyticus]AKF10985.1 putative lipoprotein [Sandaracinus amylolyticus]
MSRTHTSAPTHAWRAYLLIALLSACGAPGTDPGDDGPDDPGPDPGDVIDRDPTGPAELPPARAPERLSAQQIHASLQVATGQTWAGFEDAAATLGRPDYTQTTEEGRQMSVAFETLVGDAARATCRAAITADRALEVDDEARAILRGIDVDAPDADARRANLRRLILRFHGHEVIADDDPRVTPWLELLDAPIEPTDVSRTATAADVEAVRWEALCVGLATHPDFLTY